MKKSFLSILFLPLVLLLSCTDLDDVNERLDEQEERLTALESLVSNANTTIQNLQKLVDAQDQKISVVSYKALPDGAGYLLKMSDGTEITLKNGSDGQTPTVGIKDQNGTLYWTINGEIMRDADGNPIKAEGQDGASGVTPKIRVNTDGHWEVSLDGGKTWQTIKDENGKPVSAVGQGGTLDLTITEDENFITIIYDGQTFVIPKGDVIPGEGDENLVGIEYEKMNGRYYGNWFNPHADDTQLVFQQGEFDENGNHKSGYKLTLPANMLKLEDYNAEVPKLSVGVYTVVPYPSPNHNTLPMTVLEGNFRELWGNEYVEGAHLTIIDADRNSVDYPIKSGTMEVSYEEGDVKIIFDFIDYKGNPVQGYFISEYNMKNFNDNDAAMPKRPWSTVTEDVALNFPEDTEVVAFFLGNYLYPELNSWMLMFNSNITPGDMITTEIFTSIDQGMTLKPATYTISKEFKANTMLAGAKGFLQDIFYTWYADMTSLDEDGYVTVLGPVVDGSMIMEQDGEESYNFIFDFKDDAGNIIKGEWNGPIHIEDSSIPYRLKY